jgi:excisionase family DNA binding protein
MSPRYVFVQSAKPVMIESMQRSKGMVKEDQVFTPKEVAKTLRVSVVTISRAIREGELKAFRIGGQWRIYGSELHDYVETGTQRALRRV